MKMRRGRDSLALFKRLGDNAYLLSEQGRKLYGTRLIELGSYSLPHT